MMKPSMMFSDVKEWIKSTWVAKAMQSISVKKEHACNECQHSFEKMKSMRNHFSEAHKSLKISEYVQKCKIQESFKRFLRKYIQIEEDDEMEMNSHEDSK